MAKAKSTIERLAAKHTILKLRLLHPGDKDILILEALAISKNNIKKGNAMVTIIADNGNTGIGLELHDFLLQNKITSQYYDISDADIKPCYGCQGCTYKTFGKCVFRDDCDVIIPDIMRSEVLVFVSPVCFGSYSFRAKRMMDKFSLAGSRYYKVKNGELVKSVQGTQKRLMFIGIISDESEASRVAFEQLTHETRLITDCEGKTFIIKDGQAGRQAIGQIGREVGAFA